MENNYNWWDDPKNKEEIERISWWDHEQNKEIASLPIAIIQSQEGKEGIDGVWIASTNTETEKFLGNGLTGCAQGKTKEEAIKKLFYIIKITHKYSEECRLNYQRWVPFRKGDWSQRGGRWIVIFGIHIYFRWGKQNKHGWFIPFTPLNIIINSEWVTYKNWMKKNKSKKLNQK